MSGNKKLIDGFKRFRKKYYKDSDLLSRLAANKGAKPERLVINCPDPRNGADLVFDTEPGEQFASPLVAAIVQPYDKNRLSSLEAILEYAIEDKQISELLIMSHSQCGGLSALLNKAKDLNVHTPLVEMARNARKKAIQKVGDLDEDRLREETEKQIALLSLKNLLEYPMVRKAVIAGKLVIDVLYFDLVKGTLLEFDVDENKFKPLIKETSPDTLSIKHTHYQCASHQMDVIASP